MSLLSLAWIDFINVASPFGYRPRYRRAWAQTSSIQCMIIYARRLIVTIELFPFLLNVNHRNYFHEALGCQVLGHARVCDRWITGKDCKNRWIPNWRLVAVAMEKALEVTGAEFAWEWGANNRKTVLRLESTRGVNYGRLGLLSRPSAQNTTKSAAKHKVEHKNPISPVILLRLRTGKCSLRWSKSLKVLAKFLHTAHALNSMSVLTFPLFSISKSFTTMRTAWMAQDNGTQTILELLHAPWQIWNCVALLSAE